MKEPAYWLDYGWTMAGLWLVMTLHSSSKRTRYVMFLDTLDTLVLALAWPTAQPPR
jgi:hypothetical protein